MDIQKKEILAKQVLMIQPTNFCTNYETLADNVFMKESKELNNQDNALFEFNNFVENLRIKNVDVLVYKQLEKEAVDSVFPNNWFSTHKGPNFPEGLLIIYPLKSPIRRLEKNNEIIQKLKENYKHFIDLSFLENENEYLESTGSLIFDNSNNTIYCSLSERASQKAINIFIQEFNKISCKDYEMILFSGKDDKNNKIYHTNVLMSVLESHIIICLDTINSENEKNTVEQYIYKSGKHIIKASLQEMNNFCCNIISVKPEGNKKALVILSKTAHKNYSNENLKILESHYDLCINDINTIEKVGGGSARCMVAEIFN